MLKFLIVDDEILIRKSLARALIAKGYFCFEAENGDQALQLLANEKIDAVILDLIMPIKSGYDVISECQVQVPIFIISAFSGPELSAEYLKSDSRIQMFIKKPFDNLFLTVDQILNHLDPMIKGPR